jgi:hypothetical protein
MTAENVILVWGRDVTRYDTMDDAIDAAWRLSESDDDWFDAIELIAADGTSTRITSNQDPVRSEFNRRGVEQIKQYNKRLADRPFIGNIVIDGKILRSLYGDDDPEPEMAELRPVVGDRVRFVPVRTRVR